MRDEAGGHFPFTQAFNQKLASKYLRFVQRPTHVQRTLTFIPDARSSLVVSSRFLASLSNHFSRLMVRKDAVMGLSANRTGFSCLSA